MRVKQHGSLNSGGSIELVPHCQMEDHNMEQLLRRPYCLSSSKDLPNHLSGFNDVSFLQALEPVHCQIAFRLKDNTNNNINKTVNKTVNKNVNK